MSSFWLLRGTFFHIRPSMAGLCFLKLLPSKLSRSREKKKRKKKRLRKRGNPGPTKKIGTLAVAGFWKPLEGKASNRAADLNRLSSLFFFFLSCLDLLLSTSNLIRDIINRTQSFTMVWLFPFNHGAAFTNSHLQPAHLGYLSVELV